MSFASEANTTYPNGAAVSKTSVKALWAAVDGIVANGGKMFYTRDEAVSFGQANLPSALSRILVVNNDYLEIRGVGAADDQLFTTFPNWGVLARFPRKEVVEEISNLGDTLYLGTVTGTPTAQASTYTVDPDQVHMTRRTGTLVEFFWTTTNTDADPVVTVGSSNYAVRSKTGQVLAAGDLAGNTRHLGVIVSTTQIRLIGAVRIGDINTLQASLNAGMSTALTNIAGTGDAITADWPTGVGAPTGFFAGFRFRYTPVATNTVANPTITVSGTTRTLCGPNPVSGTLPPGSLVVGRTYVFETYGSALTRLISDPALAADTLNTAAAYTDTEVAEVDGKVKAIATGDMRSDGSLSLIGLETDTGTRIGDAIVLRPSGIDFEPSDELASRLTGASYTPAGQYGVDAVDQIITRGSTKFPVAVIDGVTRKAVIISVYGQSNADVTPMNDNPFWSTSPYPWHTFMLNDISGGRGGVPGWQGVAVVRGSTMVNANQMTPNNLQSVGVTALQRLIHHDKSLRRVGLVRSSACGGEPLIGTAGSANPGLWKDTLNAYTVPWLNWQGDIVQAYNLLEAEGYEVEAVYIIFSHQEADAGKARGVYLGQLNSFKAEKEALLATDLPGVPVHWFVDQASGSGYRTPTYQGGAWPNRMDILDFANAHANVTFVSPRYWMPHGVESGGTSLSNSIHHENRPRIPMGELYGLAMREVENGRKWGCAEPVSWPISGNSIVVTFDSLTPLVLDPTFCKVRPDMGFQLRTGSTITYPTAVILTGQKQVTVTFAAPPTVGAFLRYAYRGIETGDSALSNDPAAPIDNQNRWPLSTGALRESWLDHSIFDPGVRLVRAAPGFEKELV